MRAGRSRCQSVLQPSIPDDTISVKISGLTKYETVTDNLDNTTFRPRHGSVTLTAAEVNSGLRLNSTYGGSGSPVNTLSVTASNATPGETGTSATQSIMVTDPPGWLHEQRQYAHVGVLRRPRLDTRVRSPHC